ncbi:ATP-binding protein [Micromonospora sp. NPDC000089]|uniref:ATP-binding protein n=1 Tax=unclassified Micromonospora TaxID=2617518 RepID=UPI00369623E5
MASRISCQVRDEAGVAVVRLIGDLDLGTMRSVHGVLDRCLTDQPDALVVDLREVTVADRLALSVFVAAARQAAGWPSVPLVLCSPPPDAAAWLAESTTCRVVPVHHDCAEATRDAGASAPRLRARFEPVATACRKARELVGEACGRWNVPELVGPASLVLSELVGNVVRHAHTPMQVTLTLRRPYLHVAVTDGNRSTVATAAPGARAEGGRGLLLVRETARRWGSSPLVDGKVVWALVQAN